jgi:hypothetical protein
MGQHGQHPVRHFLLEAVHHGQHDDQRRHAEGDAGHRNQGNEGDKTVSAAALAGARVAQADQPFVRQFVDDAHGPHH